MAELISIIVTTHDREDALDAVLRSLARQTDGDFEVIVADDGSGPGTAALISQWKQEFGKQEFGNPKSGRRLEHVWHEHRGFRAGEIRNRAILESRGDYCIFLDGDCIARPDFVASHRALAERGWFVSGNRILMSQDFTRRVLVQHLEPENWNFASWVGRRSRNDINRLAPMLALPLGPLRKLRPGEWQHARSCNLAVWRNDLDRIDGFDADYNGWGREDSDLLVRLLHAGARRKDGNFATGVLHLWHPAADRSALPVNDKKLDQVQGEKRVKALLGMSSLRNEGRNPTVNRGAARS